ncbi:glycosyltransferase family 4 protein [Bradyrhizobium symbiodeficiens]|uniref:glycosyltransferase family 4 protein n=1 Tax=Bradyrhizobium symbiodeficiens TaxID=1404367 RepID=UPI000BA1AA8B|nr:glycosyltransferase family 4 protein [Bradyrhizobium symbiodeficiens]AWM05837.1 glycosyl transferase [Bradyrhizobium symbiodeficiens]
MKVLVTSSLYPTPGAPKVVGGAEIFVRRLVESLVARGDTIQVVRAASVPDQKAERYNDVEVYSAQSRNIYLPFTEQRSAPARGIWHAIEDWQRTADVVGARIDAFKPDLLHSNNLSGLTTAVWKAAHDRRIPIVHTLHDYYLTCPRCSRFSNGRACNHTCFSCKLLTISRRSATGQLSAVIGVSQRILDIHTELGLFSNTTRKVIRHASSLQPIVPSATPPSNTLRLGFIGRLTEEKGIYNLVKAVGLLPPSSVRLVIAGHASDELKQELQNLAPRVTLEFLGFIAPEKFYGQIDVVVIPPIWEEPGPIVVADARAAGKPFLGTRFGGIPEAVARGAKGWLTEPDPESLAASIRQLLSKPDEIAAMVKQLSLQTNQYTFASVVEEYRTLFENVVGSRPST